MFVNTKSTISSAKLGCDNITDIDEINPHPDTDSLDTERKGFSSKNGLEDDKNVSPECSYQPAPALCYKDVAKETGDETKRNLKQSCNQPQADVATNLITTDGGVIKLTDVILQIDAGCLAEDTEITSRIDDGHNDLKSLFDLDLIQRASNVVEFLPNDLKFLKPADLQFKHESPVPGNELFILRGSICDNQQTVWELVSSDMIQEYTEKGVVNVKIEGFSLYCYILAKRGRLARIFSHFRKSFTCFAYALYRRQLSNKIDIIVVFVSEFVEKDTDIKQLNDLKKVGYVLSDRGAAKRIQINSDLQMCLNFPGQKDEPLLFHIDQPQLDSIGYVLDRFKGVPIKFPAKGTVTISEVLSEENSTGESELPWVLNIVEQDAKEDKSTDRQIPRNLVPPAESEPKVIRRDTKLTGVEITRVSRMVAMDWDSLAGLMDIPYEEREEIRTNFAKYPDSPSKAEEVLNLFNDSDCFCRDVFGKCADELGRHDLIKKLQPMEKKKRTGIVRWKKPIPSSQIKEADNEEIKKLITQLEKFPEKDAERLSPREMSRLSRRIAVDWDSLAGLMDIAKEERDDIRYNCAIYSDHRSRAEKILSIFNHKKEFSRKKLVEGLKEIKKLDVIRPILTGKWKNL
ncbi:uncharacterized protein LOC114527016 isoform X2 [Dendronephthya gigantea]|uniref:uncharacterized protein LOC114527016 isoform X2 n=1 Tax=Dendronephthya gigantea TaxID=151771 RepID=UPI00106C1B63|nr:uncharacterized protein LOC114527016 isoform X2 [Dendronephthya gigantea]